MQPLKKLSGLLRSLADKDHYLFTAADLSGVMGAAADHLTVILSRAVKAGLLKRVCRGVYLYPPAAHSLEHLLYQAAARLRPNELNYISLEIALSDAGLISQVPMNWITLMSSGRSHVVNCGEFGRIEFVHTAQSPADLSDDLTYDADRHLWRASVSQALRDMKATRRSMDLVNLEARYESF